MSELRPSEIYFADKIKAKREQRGLTQQDLAILIGVTRATLANMEGKEVRIILGHALILSRVLDINLNKIPLDGIKQENL